MMMNAWTPPTIVKQEAEDGDLLLTFDCGHEVCLIMGTAYPAYNQTTPYLCPTGFACAECLNNMLDARRAEGPHK